MTEAEAHADGAVPEQRGRFAVPGRAADDARIDRSVSGWRMVWPTAKGAGTRALVVIAVGHHPAGAAVLTPAQAERLAAALRKAARA